MKNTKLSASILSADFTQLGDQIRLIEQAGVDWVHVDVMDGHFVPNITMGPFILEACRNTTSLPLDVHLMIETPEKYVEEFYSGGSKQSDHSSRRQPQRSPNTSTYSFNELPRQCGN